MSSSAFNGLIFQVILVLLLPLMIIPMFFYWIFFQKKF